MFDRYRILFAEQATADEIVVFLLITVLAALLVAFALYSAVLAVLWRGRLRQVTTLRGLLFPNRKQLTRYLGEYALAAGTSVLLTLTVAARHDVVQTVLEYPLYEVDTEQIRAAFAFGDLRPEELAGASGYDEAVAEALRRLASGDLAEGPGLPSIGVESLLLPSVRSGGAGNADLWLRTVVGEIPPATLARFPSETHLLMFAVFLLLLYVGWFAVARSRAVESTGRTGDTDHGRVVGRLVVPAVCIALLLASAASVADTTRVSKRATAVAALELGLDEEGRYAADLLTHAMLQQASRARPFRFASEADDTLPGVAGAIGRLEARVLGVHDVATSVDARTSQELEAIRAGMTTLGVRVERDSAFSDVQRGVLARRTDVVETDLASTRDQVGVAIERSLDAARRASVMADSLDLLRRRLATSESALGSLENDLRRLAAMLPGNGLVLVTTVPATAYQVRAGGPQGAVRATGQGVGLHALPPGAYTITSGSGSSSVTLAANGAETVQISQRLVDTGIGPINQGMIAQPDSRPPPVQD